MKRGGKENGKLRHGEKELVAKDILALLAKKHSDDVFVPECKDGPSAGTTHFRLDAWTMKKSWAHPLVTGYEIKISRSDFLGDDKWHAYLPYCNELYFACPNGLIRPEELSPEVGLLYASATGGRLFIKKKATYREANIPEDMYRYVLMCRARIVGKYEPTNPMDKAAYWREWLKTREIDYGFGLNIGKKIQETIREKIMEVRGENETLKNKIKGYEDMRAVCEVLGVDAKYVRNAEDEIKGKLQRLELHRKLRNCLDWLKRSVESTIEELDEFNEKIKTPQPLGLATPVEPVPAHLT